MGRGAYWNFSTGQSWYTKVVPTDDVLGPYFRELKRWPSTLINNISIFSKVIWDLLLHQKCLISKIYVLNSRITLMCFHIFWADLQDSNFLQRMIWQGQETRWDLIINKISLDSKEYWPKNMRNKYSMAIMDNVAKT